MTERTCRKCDGMGMVVVERADGNHLAEPCECRVAKRIALLHQRSRIPQRYLGCTLESYQHGFAGADPSLWRAFNTARGFVSNYPHQLGGTGILFTGSIGTGKTHLAVGILQALVLQKGVKALFCDHRELLKSIHNSYNPAVATTELDVLRPVFDAEVLVIDELGSAKKTEWVSDIVEHILNTRYNDKRTTILTTNYPDLPPGGRPAPEPRREPFRSTRGSSTLQSITLDDIRNKVDQLTGGTPASSGTGEPREDPEGITASRGPEAATPRRYAGGETLGDRIGERMRSRLAEMCVTVEIAGADYRQGPKRASFG